MDSEKELDDFLNSKGFNEKIREKVKRLLNVHCVQDLAECTQGQIDNIPHGPDGLQDWQKTKLIEVLWELLKTENAALKTKNAQLSAEIANKIEQSTNYVRLLITKHKKEMTDLEKQISVLTEQNKGLHSKCSRQDIAYDADPFACVANLYFIGHS